MLYTMDTRSADPIGLQPANRVLPRPPQVVRLGASLYYGGLRALGVTALNRRLRDAGLILCYHNVVPRDGDQIGDPSLHLPLARFERQMYWLAEHYDVVSLCEFIDRLAAGTSLRGVAAVTFDDGYVGVFEYALPILDALRIPATVFVVAEAASSSAGFWWDQPEIVESATPGRRERWFKALRGDGEAILSENRAVANRSLPASHRPAGWAAIRVRIGDGIELGVHSATHRSLPTLTDTELEHEIVTSRAMVKQATGVLPQFFAYPYGHWDRRVQGLVRSAGYRAGLTADYGLNGALADPWVLRRVNVPAGISDAAFEAWAAGLPGRRRV
jgi:peptidoglycan/xylan/chitin deacetylase (PgdA/CDA1 family)